MYESNSDNIFQRSCCCIYKDQKKSPIKEISNPMPLDYMFRTDSELSTFHTKLNTLKKTDNEYHSSTFPRTTRNLLPQIPVEKVDNPDLLMNQVKKSFYQEIVDKDKPQNGKTNIIDQIKTEDNKKQLDLIYVTSRILIGFRSQTLLGENNKVIRSLKNQYKKNLKIFYLIVRQTIEEDDKSSLNTVSSLPYLMPFLDDIYNFLTTVTVWLQKSKKNVILMNYNERSHHLCALCVRFILTYEDMNRRLLRIDKLILLDHESNALQYYEKMNLEKYHTSSLRRYTSTITNIMLDLVHFQSCFRHLHFIILKNIHSTDRIYEGFKDNLYTEDDEEHQNWKVRTIFLTIYQNFHLVHTSYKVTLNEKIETDRIIFIIDPIIPISGDILIMANVTNKEGFQSIYFRFQFHTCLLHGDLITFKNSELDKSVDREFESRSIGLVELHLKNQQTITRDHENMLLSDKYFVVKERGSHSKDIFDQLKLLKPCVKGKTLAYTAGPVDGSLYAAISKSCKPVKKSPKNEIPTQKKTISKYQELNKKSPSILTKFNNLEREITGAANLISTSNLTKMGVTSNHKVSKSNVHYYESNGTLNEGSIKTNKNQQTSFLPYRKSNSLSNNELPVKLDKNDRQYFFSYGKNSPKNVILKYPKFTNTEISSPYDNIFPNNMILPPTKSENITDVIYNSTNRMHESNYELVSQLNEEESQSEYISNLNMPRNNKDSIELFNDQQTPYEDINNKIFSNTRLYDNWNKNSPPELYNVLTSRNLWFKPNLSRQEAILYLLDQPVGYFLIRTSTSLSKSLSMVLKCSTSIMNRGAIENDSLDHIRHFIIDYNTEGYKIRGFNNEKYYSDLAKLIQDHLDKPIGLPCLLILPSSGQDNKYLSLKETYVCQDRYLTSTLSSSIINNYNVIYLGSFITKNLCDISAISASIDTLQERVCRIAQDYSSNSFAKMSLRITNDRIIFTDVNRKMFFRKHCKLEDIMCCEVDPKRRVWNNVSSQAISTIIPNFSPIFGVVSCLTSNTEFNNQTCCQLFLTLGYDAEDLCSAVNLARKNIII